MSDPDDTPNPQAPLRYTELPSLAPPDFPEPIYLDDTSDLTAAKKADITLFNNQLKLLHCLWKEVRSIKSALALHDRVMEMIPKRREILGLEYGVASHKITRATVFEPVD